jgi:hypothetical protein
MAVPPTRSRGGRTGAGLAALLGGLAIAAPAAAAPLDPTFPANDAVVGLRPAFTWEAAAALPGRYEVYVELPGGPVEVAEVAGTATTATAAVPLPDDVRLRWFVRAAGASGSPLDTLLAARRHIQVATPPGPPAITGSPPAITRSPAPLFAWTGSRVSSRWAVLNAAGVQVQSGTVGAPSGQAAPAPLPDGSYQFRVAQRNLVGVEGPPAAVGFSVDTVAPGGLTLRRSTVRPDSRNTPSYSWTGLEPGAVVTWRILRASGAAVQGPATAAGGQVAPATLRAGSYVFEARQTDLAGNAGPLATDPFVVLPRLAAGVRLPMRHTGRLTPSVGATVRAVRPTLRWTSGPKGTRIYNVQVFRVADGAKLRKVLSAFPKRQRFIVPRRKSLARGACYVWRVWPFRGQRALPSPLGVSHFCVRPK